ncbi:hypothetical protein [Saprospira grandis]|uniref:Uncharacterized protein n=1 Tax=Saprospira grandis (strain Lewin) TaxID=984262 RepID=H6L7V0_SAPGL|nr:hypothetical protein [Saprospira grandis]AFC24171.1 hypothetical protein SGRA_1436 [Saprospira grandis str. Lewin]
MIALEHCLGKKWPDSIPQAIRWKKNTALELQKSICWKKNAQIASLRPFARKKTLWWIYS